MKITHVVLNDPVTDYWTYQHNILPKYHMRIGYDVSIITSKYIYNSTGSIIKDDRSEYINENGIKTIRLDMKNGKTFNSRFKIYDNLYKNLELENPDILFVHACQMLDIKTIYKYIKKHPNIKVYVDNHADYSNSATNWISKNILHKIIWKRYAHMIEPYTTKFYGVLPARVKFLKDIYKLPEKKVELLVMGSDDEKVREARQAGIRENIRKNYGVKSDDFLIMTGGKIDLAKKQTLILMKAIKEIESPRVKLITFGSIVDELKEEVNKLADGDKIQYIGWVPSEETYNYFVSSDLAVFPGRHSVFWEQVVGLGIPMVVKYWEGTTHIDVGGNCKFVYEDTVEEFKSTIMEIFSDKKVYLKMKNIAENKGLSNFSYSNIAKQSIKEYLY